MNMKQKAITEKMVKGRFEGLKAAAWGALPDMAVGQPPYSSIPGATAPTPDLQSRWDRARREIEAVTKEWNAIWRQAVEDHKKYGEKLNKIVHFLAVKKSQAIEKLWLSDLPEALTLINSLVDLEMLKAEMATVGVPTGNVPKELPPVDLG